VHILLLTQILPYPPDAGPRIKTWHVLRYLVEGRHRVTLVSFIRPEEEPHLPTLRALCAEVLTVPIRRSRVADVGHWLRSHLSGRPFLIERDDSRKMRALIDQILREKSVDVIHADQLTMTQFALPRKGEAATHPYRVFDAHNATWTILARMRHGTPWFLRPVLALEMQRVKRYEGQLVHAFDHTLAVTDIDRQALHQAADSCRATAPVTADRLSVIPIAVDTAQLQPIQRQPDSQTLLTLGTLHYPPNADGIRWFIQHVFPLIRQSAPAASLLILGKNPPADFARLAAQSAGAITVTGYVPEVKPYLERSALVVIPVLAGGGMRVRILEALSHGMPTVTTTIGMEGIEARPGEDLLVGDRPEDFAAAVIQVLADPALRERLSANGRRLATTRYDWQVVLRQLDAVYARASKPAPQPQG
jgi:glycosyltransferase involved in cell wall biosynthesis